jgi:hypothetical protein
MQRVHEARRLRRPNEERLIFERRGNIIHRAEPPPSPQSTGATSASYLRRTSSGAHLQASCANSSRKVVATNLIHIKTV